MQKLLLSFALTAAAAIIGSIFTYPAISTWYNMLTKPWFTPPNWVFGPVWTILYILMAYALYIIWQKGVTKKNRFAVEAFMLQLILNTLWSIVFFGLKWPAGAFGVIVALWISILVTILEFRKLSPKAAYLMIPYLLWVTYASFLNFHICCWNSR